MNRAITIAYRGEVPTILTGPEVPVREQTQAFKRLLHDGVEGFDALELWTSSMGRVKRKPLKSRPAPAPAKQAPPAEEEPTAEPITDEQPATQAKKGKK